MITVPLNHSTTVQLNTETPQDVGIGSGVVFLSEPGKESRLPVKFDIVGDSVGVESVEEIRQAIAVGLAQDGWSLVPVEVRLGKAN